jgi:hypothetical protein
MTLVADPIMTLEVHLVYKVWEVRALYLLSPTLELLITLGIGMMFFGAGALAETACIVHAPSLVVPIETRAIPLHAAPSCTI